MTAGCFAAIADIDWRTVSVLRYTNKEPMQEHLFSFPRLLTIGRTWLFALGFLVTLNAGAEGVAVSSSGSDAWREEVLLHDGQKMVIERSQSYGGRSEIGQDAPVADHTVRFIVPKGQQTIEWNSPFDHEIGRTSLRLLAVHVKDGMAYVVTEPNLCLSYNKWGRPNPPYVMFQWQTNSWQRIGIEALPQEFSTMNVSQRLSRMWAKDRRGTTLTAAQIQTENTTNQPQYRSILREPINHDPECIPMVTNGMGLWLARGRFSSKPSLEACVAECKRERFEGDTCPCSQLFKVN